MKVFPIAPAGSGPFIFFIVLALVMLTVATLFFFFAYSTRSLRFELAGNGLSIKGDMYGRTIPYHTLMLDEMRVLNLDHDADFRPHRKTNGSALPNFRTGWFRLRNGAKSLLFVTDASRVVMIPTRDGYTLMLSPGDTDGFIAALKASAK